MEKSKTAFYHKQGLWLLYLVCAFPFLFWTLLLGFRDIDWVSKRTNLWDALGVVSYGMAYAFVEGLVWFALTAALGFLVSRRWSVERRVALMGTLLLLTALWSMLEQTYFLTGARAPLWALRAIAATGRPVLAMYIVALALVSLSVVVPVYFILRSEKALKFTLDFMDRLSTLTLLYLFLSFAGMMIILVRNL